MNRLVSGQVAYEQIGKWPGLNNLERSRRKQNTGNFTTFVK